VTRRFAVALITALALMAATPGAAFAQSAGEPVDGIITEVATGPSGELQSFKLIDAAGNAHEYRVTGGNIPTQYGLENQAGDRWVSDQARDPAEAARRMRDHQERFAPITVTADGDTALTVVERESGKLETNLSYLFAIYTVTWVAFFAYVFLLSRRQRDLQREIARLKAALPGSPGFKQAD
jgi:CcmD family protein